MEQQDPRARSSQPQPEPPRQVANGRGCRVAHSYDFPRAGESPSPLCFGLLSPLRRRLRGLQGATEPVLLGLHVGKDSPG